MCLDPFKKVLLESLFFFSKNSVTYLNGEVENWFVNPQEWGLSIYLNLFPNIDIIENGNSIEHEEDPSMKYSVKDEKVSGSNTMTKLVYVIFNSLIQFSEPAPLPI